jgi:hypothetical protein
MENFNLSTNLISLSLADFSHSFHTVTPPFTAPPGLEISATSSSSFLTDSLLFKTGSYEAVFFITATNIYTGRLLYNYTIRKNKPKTIATTAFFSNARYNEFAFNRKNVLTKYLNMAAIGVNYLGGSLWDIEISAPLQTMGWTEALLSLGTTAAGTYAINSIPNTYGFSIFIFTKTKALSIKNTLDINTGFYTDSNAVPAKDEWENKVESANNFIKEKERKNIDAAAIIIGKKVYVHCIDKAAGMLYLYQF